MDESKPETSKIVTLLDGLVEATKDGRLQWSAGADEKYRVSLGVAVLEIERERPWLLNSLKSGTGSSPSYSYVTYLRSLDDDKVLDVEFFDPNNPDYEIAKNAYEAARKQVNNVDQILDAMISKVRSGR